MLPLLLALLISACATPAGPRGVVLADGFTVVVLTDQPAVQRACNRLAGHITLPSGGCYHPIRDIAVVIAGDGISIRHEVCHHRGIQRGIPPWLSEIDCSARWHY